MFDFKDGDVIFTAEPFSPSSFWIKWLQGDFDYSHVCQYFGGKIYTTGAGGPLLYRFGTVDPTMYLTGKAYAVKRYQGLTDSQTAMLKAKADALIGQRYPIEKMIRLAILGKTTSGVIKRLGLKPNPWPKNSFCSGTVVMCFQFAGIKLNIDAEKQEPDAYSPEAVWDDPLLKLVFRQR